MTCSSASPNSRRASSHATTSERPNRLTRLAIGRPCSTHPGLEIAIVLKINFDSTTGVYWHSGCRSSDKFGSPVWLIRASDQEWASPDPGHDPGIGRMRSERCVGNSNPAYADAPDMLQTVQPISSSCTVQSTPDGESLQPLSLSDIGQYVRQKHLSPPDWSPHGASDAWLFVSRTQARTISASNLTGTACPPSTRASSYTTPCSRAYLMMVRIQ